MHPVLFHAGPITIYTYGFFIALGTVLGGLLMWRMGKKRYGMSFEQANNLVLLLVIAGVVGGKLFVIFESPSYYASHPAALVSHNGFVFYGSLLTAIPVMLWYFRKHKLPVAGMLDVMAFVTCVVHGFGRIGCFNAGCCYGTPTHSVLGVTFTNPTCQAPLNTPLHPSQLYEAALIFGLLIILFFVDRRKKFDGQVFLVYLIIYGAGRAILELFRGDLQRGFVIEGFLSVSQAISVVLVSASIYFYVKLKRKANFPLTNAVPMENESFGQRIARATKKILKRILLVAIVLGLAIMSFLYFGVYERGVIAGKVLRITEKGVVFKTWEGKLNLETFGALKGVSPIAESFDFSVEADQKAVLKDLEKVSLSGERVNLKYVKRYAAFPWRGDTKYFVEGVERLNQP